MLLVGEKGRRKIVIICYRAYVTAQQVWACTAFYGCMKLESQRISPSVYIFNNLLILLSIREAVNQELDLKCTMKVWIACMQKPKSTGEKKKPSWHRICVWPVKYPHDLTLTSHRFRHFYSPPRSPSFSGTFINIPRIFLREPNLEAFTQGRQRGHAHMVDIRGAEQFP